MRDEPDDRGLAIGAGDRGGRNPTILARREQRIDDGLPDGPGSAHRGLQVHAQPRARIHLDHDATLCLQRLGDVGGDDVDACHVEPDDPRRLDGPRRHLRMHAVGDVLGPATGAQVGVVPQEHHSAGRGHALRGEALLGEHGDRHRVDHHRAQRRGMVAAPPGILVDAIDELPHGGDTVPLDRGRMPPGRRHHPAADDEHPVVATGDEPLDDDRPLAGMGDVPGLLHFCLRDQIDRDAVALVSVPRLHHDRAADLLRHLPRLGRIAHRTALGHRDARLREQRPRQFLVLGDGLRDGPGLVGLRRQDPPLLRPLPEPHERPFREPPRRDAAGHGRLHDRPRARAELHVEQHAVEPPDLGRHVERGPLDRGHDEPLRRVQALDRERLLLVFDDDVVDAAVLRLPRPAVAHRRARQRLQLERHMLEHVPHPGAGPQPLEEPAAFADGAAMLHHARQPRHDPVVESGERVGGKILEPAEIDHGLEAGKGRPLVGAAQNPK